MLLKKPMLARLPGVRSLRQRVGLHVALLIIASLLVSVVTLIGMERLRSDLGVAVRGYEEIRQIYDAGLNLSMARSALRNEPPLLDEALRQLQLAQGKLSQSTFSAGREQSAMSPDWTNSKDRFRCIDAMTGAIRSMRIWIDDPHESEKQSAARGDIARAVEALEQTTVNARIDITDHQLAADAQRRSTLIAVGSFSILLVLAATIVAIKQYRAVMRPLDRLSETVRRFAAGEFSLRAESLGDREFAALATDFNRMAAELDGFYHELQSRVAAQSRELARSQRLASVGFLAAGVSHEINNPLGIITGYAERILRLLDSEQQPSDSELWSQTRRAIVIICEEAFRCKSITSRLLSLARPGGETLARVSLVAVARKIVSNLAGLPEYADRQLILETPDGPSGCFIEAREGDMEQVVLNLTLNALQAVTAPAGQVRIIVRAIEDLHGNNRMELAIRDNGRGIAAENLDRIFEPFYSDSPAGRSGRSASRGSGLGLSITYAIVTEHHGRITAESDGIGKGSRFILTFPAVMEVARGMV